MLEIAWRPGERGRPGRDIQEGAGSRRSAGCKVDGGRSGLGVTMQLTEAPLNRRNAMDAEADQSQSPEDLSLKGDWFGHPLPRFLCAHRVSAVRCYVPRLNRHCLERLLADFWFGKAR
jgi:hypothetical protein